MKRTAVGPAGGSQDRLLRVGRVALFFDGQDAWGVRMLEDMLTVELARHGLHVAERAKQEHLLAEELAKRRAALASLAQEKEGAVPSDAVALQVMPNASQVARMLQADTAITGSVLHEVVRTQRLLRNPPEEVTEMSEKVVIVGVSFQLIDAASGELLAAGAGCFDERLSIPEAADALARAIYNVVRP